MAVAVTRQQVNKAISSVMAKTPAPTSAKEALDWLSAQHPQVVGATLQEIANVMTVGDLMTLLVTAEQKP